MRAALALPVRYTYVAVVAGDAYPVRWTGRQAVVTLPERIDLSNAGQVSEKLLWVINRGAVDLIADPPRQRPEWTLMWLPGLGHFGRGGGDGFRDPGQEIPDRRRGHLVQDRPVEYGAHGTRRGPVGSGQRERAGPLTGNCQREVGIQHREEPTARPDGLPSQRQRGTIIASGQVAQPHLGEPGQARHGAQRTDPDQVGNALSVGIGRSCRQKPATGKLRKPGPCGIGADIHQYFVVDKHPFSEPARYPA